MNYVWLTLAVGAVGIGAYLVINATSSNACSGGILDYINPACWLSGVSSEVNTILILVALVIIAVVALVAFGPGGEHISKVAALALV